MTQHKDTPNPWAHGDGPLPRSNKKLVDEIIILAAARRKEALDHPAGHMCDGCRIRRNDELLRALSQRAA